MPSILPGAHLTCFSQPILLHPPPLSRHQKGLEQPVTRSTASFPQIPPSAAFCSSVAQLGTSTQPLFACGCLAPYISSPHTDCNVNRFSLRRRTRPCVSCFAFIHLVSGLLTPAKLTSCHCDSLLRLSSASRAPAQIRPSALRSTSELTLERTRRHKSLRTAQIVSLLSQCRAKAESAPLGRLRTISSSR